MRKIAVYARRHGNALSPASREALGFGSRLAKAVRGEASALIFGAEAADAVPEAFSCGADAVYISANPMLNEFQPELHAYALETAFRQAEADILILPFDQAGKKLAGKLAALLEASAITEVTDFQADESEIRWIRPVYGDKALGVFAATRPKVVAALRPKSQEPPEPVPGQAGEVVSLDIDIPADVAMTRLAETIRTALDGIRLEDARIVVAGGRGLGGPEGFDQLKSLADVLGAAVGASRVACDNGWAPYSWQIGQTGAVIAPALYIAVGISGASQHLAGISNAKTVVAINTDPEAPIFRRANIGVVADYRTVLPALADRLKHALQASG
jgi:electron transfer flavoprotein alpha subunit